MNTYKFALFFFISCINYSQSEVTLIEQTNSIYTKTKAKYPKDYTNGINELKELLQSQDTLSISEGIANIYHKIALLYETNEKPSYRVAIKNYEKASKIRGNIEPINYKKYNNSLYNMSNCYKHIDKSEKRKIIDTILKHKSNDKFYYRAKNSLATILTDEGDYFAAIDILNSVIISYDIYEDLKTLFKSYSGVIFAYSKMEKHTIDLDEINDIKNQIENIIEEKPYWSDQAPYNNLGNIYKDFNQYQPALTNYKKALSSYIKKGDSINMGQVYMNIGVIYSKQKKFKIANEYYDKALNITDEPNIVADVYVNKGYYLPEEQYKTTLDYYDRALRTVLKDSSSINNLPDFDKIKDSEYKLDILFYLNDIADCLVTSYEKEKDAFYLEKARATLYLIDKLVSLIRYDSSSEQSKLFWINKGVNSYMLGVKTCYLLGDKEGVFYFMEKNKSLLLLENLNDREQKLSANIPKRILTRTYNLRYEVIKASEIYRLNPNDKNISEHYLKKEQLFSRFLDSIKRSYPGYSEIKKVPNILSLKKTREIHVTKGSNFIEYILDDDSGFGIFCHDKGTAIFELEDAPKLIKELDSIRSQMSKPFSYKEDFKRYNAVSFSIFNTLFPFENALEAISNKGLIIVPDYKLQYLPFDALVTKSDSNISNNYLIGKTEISYNQSASVFQQINEKHKTEKKKFLGIAPVIFDYDSLRTLQESEKGMKRISSLFPSKLLSKQEATKQSFISNLNTHNIIHLNTHAGLNKNNKPWIAFSDKKMEAEELYGLNNQAELVVLDACKTADGNMQKGEGVMNLSRAFFYGGAKSVVASLWNVNQQSNDKILLSFYENLEDGQTKSKALRDAKLSYLNSHQNKELSPYYWSSLILTGDIEAIEIVSYAFWLKTILAIVLLLVLFFIFRKKRISHTS